MAKQALILTDSKALVDWNADIDYSTMSPDTYRAGDHTIITAAFTNLPAGWENDCWVWNDDRSEFDKVNDLMQNTPANPYPSLDLSGCGEIDIETVDVNANGFGNLMHLDTDGNWIDAKGDAAATMPCMALALESGTGLKKLLKKGFIRNDAWSLTVGAWIYVSYSSAGASTQSIASATGEIQQKIGYAVQTNVWKFDPGRGELKYK